MASYESKSKSYPIQAVRFLIFGALFLSLVLCAESKFKVVAADNPAIAELVKTVAGSSASTAPARPRCGCKGAEGPRVCASNGLQYKNMCFFQCIQNQNPRLTVIRTGSCAGLTRENYFTKGPEAS